MKKYLLLTGISIVLIAAIFMVYTIVEKRSFNEQLQIKLNTAPVHLALFNPDSSKFTFPTGKRVMVVLFNSGCEHCQYEIATIKKRLHDFNQAELVFISDESLNAIRQTASAFDSLDSSHVRFVKVNPEDVFEHFGAVKFPTILIYDTEGKLIKVFKGETKIDTILKYLK